MFGNVDIETIMDPDTNIYIGTNICKSKINPHETRATSCQYKFLCVFAKFIIFPVASLVCASETSACCLCFPYGQKISI